MKDASELSSFLASSAESFCRDLFPEGKIVRGKFHIGSVRGEAGKSLDVTLTGQYAGRWSDRNPSSPEEATGDLIDLWRLNKGITLREAVRDLNSIHGFNPLPAPKKIFKKSKRAKPARDFIPVSHGGNVYKYLAEQRKLDPTLFKELVQQTMNDDAYVFVFLSQEKRHLMTKYFKVKRGPNGEKDSWMSAGTTLSLFGMNRADMESNTLVICEGEIDCITLWMYGVNAVSIPNGFKVAESSQTDWIANCWDFLSCFRDIVICFDNERDPRKSESVRSSIENVCKRVGEYRCRVCSLPLKDPNECHLNQIDPSEYIAKAEPVYKSSVLTPVSLIERLEEYSKDESASIGDPFLLGDIIKVRKHELTLWSGHSHSGKSEIVNHLMLHLAFRHNHKAFIASMETTPVEIIDRMQRQAKGGDSSISQREALSCLENRIFIYDCYGQANVKDLLENMRYVYGRFGVSQVVIDSFGTLDVEETDYERHRQVVMSLFEFARDTGCHVHLVAHSTKPGPDGMKSPPATIKGSGDLVNRAHNIYVVFREGGKDAEIRQKEQETGQQFNRSTRRNVFKTQDDNNPCGRVYVRKNKKCGHQLPIIPFYFDNESLQFMEAPHSQPINYVREEEPF